MSHPHTAFFSQQVAAGLESEGALAGYACGLAVADGLLPSTIADDLTRRFPRARNRLVGDVAASHLLPISGPEALARLGGRMLGAGPARAVSWYDVMFVLHDALVAALPWPRGTGAVYAYEDGALATFRRARRAELRRFYDLPIPHYATIERIIRGEIARFPEAEPERNVSEPPWKKRRKDAELELADA
ncbi:MAG: hypothetical protein ACOC9T_02810, partial [Myxococcota bacterium]